MNDTQHPVYQCLEVLKREAFSLDTIGLSGHVSSEKNCFFVLMLFRFSPTWRRSAEGWMSSLCGKQNCPPPSAAPSPPPLLSRPTTPLFYEAPAPPSLVDYMKVSQLCPSFSFPSYQVVDFFSGYDQSARGPPPVLTRTLHTPDK